MNILLSMDVEASGPVPNHGDMISFAAIVMDQTLDRGFDSGNMRPECDSFSEGAYKAIGMTRKQHLAAPYSIEERIKAFDAWLTDLVEDEFQKSVERAIAQGRTPPTNKPRCVMVSDNPGFDFMWVAVECWNKLGRNPLGHSARRISDVWSGLRKRRYETQGWKKHREAPHDHTPYNDALGNAQAWNTIWAKHGE